MEERGRSRDDDDTDEGQEGGALLLPGEGFAGDEQGADVAAHDGAEESEDGGFGEGQVEEREIQPEDTEEAEEAARDEEREKITGAEGEMGDMGQVAVREGEGGGQGLAREEDLGAGCC